MADPTSVSASAAPPAEARPAPPTSPQTPPSATAPNQTPAAPTTGQQPQVSEDERVRRLQATYTQRQRQLEQQLLQRDQTMAQLQQQLDQLQTKDMDEEEARAYRANKYIQSLEAQVQQQQQMAAAYQADLKVNAALYKMASKTAVPFEELREKYIETGDADEVWSYAYDQSTQRLTAAQVAAGQKAAQQIVAVEEEAAEIATEKEVDLGSGKSQAKKSDWETAIEQNDSKAAVLAYLANMRSKQR